MQEQRENAEKEKLIGVFKTDKMTPRQLEVHDNISNGPRGGIPLPFLAMLDAPDIAEKIQELGAAIRFNGKSSLETRELATLATAAALGSGYEWEYHLAIARRCGIAEHVIACAAGKSETGVDPSSMAIIRFCRDAVIQKTITRERLAELVKYHAREVGAEVVAIIGYYQMLALYLAAAELDFPVDVE